MQKLLPLVLSAKAATWRVQDDNAESADSEFRVVRPKVLDRDQHTCRFCGFRDKGSYMQVHHRDDDHHNNSMENLVTACMHCHAVFHIGLWGSKKEAVIIDLPEIEQWQLSHVCRAVLVAQHYPAKLAASRDVTKDALDAARRMADAATAFFARLRARELQANDLIMTSDPQDLANVLHQLPTELYEGRQERIKTLRLLILGKHAPGDGGVDVIPGIVQGWMERSKDRNGPFAGLLPKDWMNLGASTPVRKN